MKNWVFWAGFAGILIYKLLTILFLLEYYDFDGSFIKLFPAVFDIIFINFTLKLDTSNYILPVKSCFSPTIFKKIAKMMDILNWSLEYYIISVFL